MKPSKPLKRVAATAACVSLLPMLVAAASAQPAGQDEVVARLGGSELRLSELKTLLDRAGGDGRARPVPNVEQLDRVIRTEVFRRAVLAEAKAKGWDQRPEVQEQMARARELALVTAYMNSMARPEADYPSEEELLAFYAAAEANLAVPRQFLLAQIYIGGGDGSKRKAEEVAARARARQADFAAIARAESQHKPSAEQGGSLGWLAEAGMVSEVRGAVASAGKGDVLGPVRTAQGWHVLKVLDTRPARTRTLAEVRDELVAALRQRKAQENERRYLDELVAKHALVVDHNALGKLVAQEASRAPEGAPAR